MKKQNGFTLLEVMVGLVILAIGLLGVANMTTVGIRTNANAGHLTEAYQAANGEMEKLKAIAWGSLANGSGVKEFRGVTYTNAWTVTTNGNIKTINLTVTWFDGNDHRVDLKTKVAR